MGVDAQMLVRVPRPITDAELREWSYRLGSMANHWLFLGSGEKVYHKPLERVSEYMQDGDTLYPRDGETFLTVPLGGRYYGEGYERGDLLAYVGIAEFIEALIPSCTIWYGGDSSGVQAEPFNKARRAELLYHAATVGHDPYNAGWDNLSRGDGFKTPTCPVCDFPIPRHGWGGNGTFASYYCSGCGWQVEHKNGKTRQGFNLKDEPAHV